MYNYATIIIGYILRSLKFEWNIYNETIYYSLFLQIYTMIFLKKFEIQLHPWNDHEIENHFSIVYKALWESSDNDSKCLNISVSP